MGRIWIDIDDVALARAAEILGTETVEETVNAALRSTARGSDRAAALVEMRELVAEGSVDIDVLNDKRQYRQ